MEYLPGDVLCILPENPIDEVREVARYCGFDATHAVEVTLLDVPGRGTVERKLAALPDGCTVEQLLQRHLDIMGAPRRFFFMTMAHLATAEHERERLQYFASSEGQDEMRWYCTKEKRTVLEVLMDFPSLEGRIPLARLLDCVPLLQAREFSISSSWKLHPGHAQVTAAVVRYRTALKRERKGLCTTWLAARNDGDVARVWIKRNAGLFAFPKDPSRPLLMVGPGTGVAPFRAFVQERLALIQSQGRDSVGPAVLYYGCRHAAKDWLYKEEFERAIEAGALTEYHVACSRDGPPDGGKTYVQHLLARPDDQATVDKMLRQGGGVFFLSGSSVQMPDNVREAIVEAIQVKSGLDPDAAEAHVAAMEKARSYCTETWQ
mmetsp:Transcript_15410/g.60220  ORF Transcript_15410/g.60220 Transcript_15410/m.60220 type:complete len:376 (-) Transcript_15410:20-1147(-)